MKKIEKNVGNKGFSLIELIIVIAIMAVLIAVLAPQYIAYIEKTRQGKDADAAGVVQRVIKVSMADTDIEDRPNGGFSVTKLSDIDDGTHDDFVNEICQSLGASDLATFEASALTSNAYRGNSFQVDIDSTCQKITVTVFSNNPNIDDIVVE